MLLVLLAVPAQAPADERLERCHQLTADLGQLISHLDRHGGRHLAVYQSCGLQLLEPLGEHPVGQSRHAGEDLGEPARAAGHGQQNGGTPPAADQLHRRLEKAALVVIDVLP